MIRVRILSIGTYNRGTFTARILSSDGEFTYTLLDKARDWKRLYDYFLADELVNIYVNSNLVAEIIG